MEKTHTFIEHAIADKKDGELIFPTDFNGTGSQTAINKALSRLLAQGMIKRLAHGIYYRPKIDPLLGELRPSPEDVVKMLAQKEKIRVRPAGAYAVHRLGLTTQVPTKLVYITDGQSRQFNLGKMQIKFKSTVPKKLATKGEISSLVIQALEEIGTEFSNSEIEDKIITLLKQEDPDILKHDLSLAPAKINDYIVSLFKKHPYDRMATTNKGTTKSKH